MLVAVRGHNYDVDSYVIVAEIFLSGGNVYASTNRYNYGPFWLHIISIVYYLASYNEITFRYMISAFLSLVDIGIFIILFRKLGKTVAYLFFLNPLSIIISGYHSQFDNLAIFFAMLSSLLIGEQFDRPLNKRKFIGVLMLGVSLLIKHVFIAFPLWLAIKQKGALSKLIFLLVPVTIFILAFIPYWEEGRNGIIQNVFLYKSWDQQNFYRLFVPAILQMIFTARMVWLLMVVGFGFIYRRKSLFESLILYSVVFVATAAATGNAYLIIPTPFIITNLNPFINPFATLYLIVGTWHLLVDVNGLHIHRLQQIINIDRNIYYTILVCILWFSIVWYTWRQKISDLYRNCVLEIKIQLDDWIK